MDTPLNCAALIWDNDCGRQLLIEHGTIHFHGYAAEVNGILAGYCDVRHDVTGLLIMSATCGALGTGEVGSLHAVAVHAGEWPEDLELFARHEAVMRAESALRLYLTTVDTCVIL